MGWPGTPVEDGHTTADVLERMRQPAEPKWPGTPIGPNDAGAGSGQSASGSRGDLQDQEVERRLAREQGTMPLVRDARGNFVRDPLGEMDEAAEFPVYTTAKGETFRINPDTDVVLHDPTTGKRMAFARNPKTDQSKLDVAGGVVAEGLQVGPIVGAAGRAAGAAVRAADRTTQAGIARANAIGLRSAGQMQAAERVQDLGAFAHFGVPAFPPAFADKGVARVARTVEEMPSFVGNTVKKPKTETLMDLGEAQNRLARDLNAPSDDLAAGQMIQRGLHRFRDTGTRELEPGVLGDLGIQARAPGPYVGDLVEAGGRQTVRLPDGAIGQLDPERHIVMRDAGRAAVYEITRGAESAMSAGATERAAQAAPIREALGGGQALTSRGVTVPAARGLEQVRVARRGVDDLSDAELQRLMRAPSAETSFASRQEALYEHAHRQLPRQFRIDESANPQQLRAVNTLASFRNIANAEQRAGVSGGIAGGRFGGMAERVRTNVTLPTLRTMRTEIGRALGNFGVYDARLDRTQLKDLYAAISRDIEVAYQDLANRAYIGTQRGHNRPDRVEAETARAADRALYEFRRADRFTRMGVERMDRFSRLVGADNPQDAVRMLGRFINENTGNAQAISAMRSALRPEEWRSIAGHVVGRLGRGRPGAQEAEAVWNPSHFATDWAKLKDSAAAQTFFGGLSAETRQSLDYLARAAERMKYYETTRNYSGSAYSGIPFVTAAGALMSGGVGAIVSIVGQVGGAVALGKFLTSPRYLRILASKMDEEAQMLRKLPADTPLEIISEKRMAHAATALHQLMRLAVRDDELAPVLNAVAEEIGVFEDSKAKRDVNQGSRPQ
jgi:hypothetical protein